MKKKVMDYVFVITGLLLLGLGFVLLKALSDPQGFMSALPFVCIGVGSGVFGHGMGNVISFQTLKNSPDIQKQIEIDQRDERNIAISNRSKAKSYDLMIFVFGALMLSFALMGVDITAVLLLVFSYLLVIGYGIYYRLKYEREM